MENDFPYCSSKLYVLGTQKNCLDETVLLSTKAYVVTDEKENNRNFTLNKFAKLCNYMPGSERVKLFLVYV